MNRLYYKGSNFGTFCFAMVSRTKSGEPPMYLDSKELSTIHNAVTESSVGAELYAKIEVMAISAKEREDRNKEEKARRSQAIPLEVPNFSAVSPGTLVTRSEHYLKECFNRNKGQIGIITNIKICRDDLSVASYWPEVHWVGEYSSSMCHPLNVSLNSGEKLPTIIMNSNQQS